MPASRIVPAAVFLSVSLLASSASADSGLYLNLPPVKGLSMEEGRNGWIDISSLQWGVGVAVDWSTEKGTVSAPSASGITWTQAFDTTYPQLQQKLIAPPGGTAQFDVVLPGARSSTPYLSLVTGGTAVDGVSFGNNFVSGSLAYNSITMTWDQSARGRSGGKTSTTFDLTKGTVEGSSSFAPTVPVGNAGPLAAAAGQTQMYLRLGSGSAVIAGDATAQGYENWFQLDSAQFGAGRSVSTTGGKTTTASNPSFSDLTVSDQASAALPAIFAALASGKRLMNATLEYVQGGAKGPVTFMQMYMEDVYLSSLSLSTGSGSDVSYSESLSFAKFSQTVWAINEDGSRGDAVSFGYDQILQKPIAAKLAPAQAGFGAGSLAGMAAGSELPGPVTPVPEPGQWALLLAGLGLMAGIARRRRAA